MDVCLGFVGGFVRWHTSCERGTLRYEHGSETTFPNLMMMLGILAKSKMDFNDHPSLP